MTSTEYTVVGMTCGHCVASVREEVSRVPGVSDTDVELATGRLVVTGESPVDRDLVRAAVEEAGYELVG